MTFCQSNSCYIALPVHCSLLAVIIMLDISKCLFFMFWRFRFDSQVFHHPSGSVWIWKSSLLVTFAPPQSSDSPHCQRHWCCNSTTCQWRWCRYQQETGRGEREGCRRHGGSEEKGEQAGEHRVTSCWGGALDDQHNWQPTPPHRVQTRERESPILSLLLAHLFTISIQPPPLWLALCYRSTSPRFSSLAPQLPCYCFTVLLLSPPLQLSTQRQGASPGLHPPNPTSQQRLPTAEHPHPTPGSRISQGGRKRSSSAVQMLWAREGVPQVLLTGNTSTCKIQKLKQYST